LRRVAAALLLGLAAAGCHVDPYSDPLPGHDARVVLAPGETAARVPWPVAYRRGARFRIENGTGAPVEAVILDLSGKGEPRELVEAVVEEPAGKPVTILAVPHGLFPLRARLGDPGSTLLEPGESLVLRVRVEGAPGRATAVFTVPR
jgi:hypothetical protein